MTGLHQPYAGDHPITQGFLGTYSGEPLGYVSLDRLSGKRSFVPKWSRYDHVHLAEDVGMPTGTDLLAPCAGKVVVEGIQSDGAHFLRLLIHKDGIRQTVIHYHHISSAIARVGEHVAAGQHIAESGATGHVTGPHLHWEVMVGSATADPHYANAWRKVDPKECLVGGKLASSNFLVPNV